MVDIPEHLLKRSRDAKAKAATGQAEEPAVEDVGDAADAVAEVEAAEVPATTEADETEVPAAEAPGELKPIATATPARVEATPVYAPVSRPTGTRPSYRGARVPGWLIPVYILVPLLIIALGMSIVNAVEEEDGGKESAGPDGEAIYAKNCASCHGAEGGGGVGPALAAVGEVFPDFKVMYDWVANVAAVTDGPYGEGGKGNNGEGSTSGRMPAFEGTLSQQEIYAVVAHEREVYGGLDPSTFPPAAEYGGADGESTESAGSE